MSETDRLANRFCQFCGRQAPAVELVMAHSVRSVIVVLKGPLNLSNLEFALYPLLVFHPFIFYNASKIAHVGI